MLLYVGCLLFQIVAKWLYKAFDCGADQKYQVGVPPVALQVKYFLYLSAPWEISYWCWKGKEVIVNTFHFFKLSSRQTITLNVNIDYAYH